MKKKIIIICVSVLLALAIIGTIVFVSNCSVTEKNENAESTANTSTSVSNADTETDVQSEPSDDSTGFSSYLSDSSDRKSVV